MGMGYWPEGYWPEAPPAIPATIIEEALYAYLVDDAGIYALMGERLYPLTIPQDVELPAVAYQRISSPREMAHDGPTGQASPRFQFTVVAETFAEARELANEIRDALNGYQGLMSGVWVDWVAVDGESDGEMQTSGRATVRLDVVVWHRE